MQPIPSVETKISWYKMLLTEVNKRQNKAIQDLFDQLLEEEYGNDEDPHRNPYNGLQYCDAMPEIYEQRTTDSMIYWFENDYQRGKALSRAIIKLTVTPQQELEWLESVLPELESWLGMYGFHFTCLELRDTNPLFRELIQLSLDYHDSWPCEILLPTLYKYQTYNKLKWFKTQKERVAAVKNCIKELKLSQNGNES